VDQIQTAVDRLDRWISNSGWVGYDPFDGLSAPGFSRLTFRVQILRIALQQTVRRFPLNLRPILGITKKHSTKAMGYFATSYLRLHKLTGRQDYLEKAKFCLSDLHRNHSQGYAGYAWGNAFDYQSRGGYNREGVPTVVWTSFIGHGIVDAYELLGDQNNLEVARSACEFILRDLTSSETEDQSFAPIGYLPHDRSSIHNSNMLGASLLARVHKHTGESELIEVSRRAVKHTMDHQREDVSWYYGEGLRWRWVDGYHTGFVLDALHWYMESTDDSQYQNHLQRGMDYYRQRLFAGVMPKHYNSNTYPIDIQAVAQAIQTFALIPNKHGGNLAWAEEIANWAIQHMQDPAGYFYFRRHRLMTNKTPVLHWGQSTMLAALTLLLQRRQAVEVQALAARQEGDRA